MWNEKTAEISAVFVGLATQKNVCYKRDIRQKVL